MKIADVFLLPSQQESFGLAALEAMAAGVPVVSSNAGGIPEVNEHGITGFTHDIGDVDAMAKSAIDLLSNEQKLNTFKQNAKKHSQKFSLENVLPQYERLYCATANYYNNC